MAQLTNGNNELTWGGVIDAVQNIEDYTSTSLFQYTKRSTINSRVFLEKSLAGEEILNSLMLNIMNLYTGLIMTAMDMNRYITSTKKVRDAMQVVATEDLKIAPKFIKDQLDGFFLGTQSVSERTRMEIVNSKGDHIYQDRNTSDLGYANNNGSSVVDAEPKSANLPSGRIIEINFGSNVKSKDPNMVANSFTIHLLLQLLPTFVPTEVAQAFIGLNFTPSIKQRWLQMGAGEISMVKDFILGQDMRKKRMKALKNDKSGVLRDMLDRQENSLANSWLKMALVTPERQNIANTILIFEKSSFDKACSNAGLRFKDYNSRQKFFGKTFAMMLCTVDPMYNKIDMYYHGLQAVSSFTFDQVKRNSKTESVDLMSIMKTYAQGMAPKF